MSTDPTSSPLPIDPPLPGAPELPPAPVLPPPAPARGSLLRNTLTLIGAAGLFLFKFGAVILKVKFLGTGLTMLVSVWAYTLLWGWKFAVGFVLMLFVHEFGHVIELRRQGIPATAPMFIPFMGAFVTMKGEPQSAAHEARSALAGPLSGGAVSAVVAIAGAAWDSPLLTALAFTGFLLNMFNLVPALPLDGGRVAAVMHPSVWIVGLAALAGLMVWHPSIVIAVVMVIGARELHSRWRRRNTDAGLAYRSVPLTQRINITVTYVLLIAALAGGMAATYVPRRL